MQAWEFAYWWLGSSPGSVAGSSNAGSSEGGLDEVRSVGTDESRANVVSALSASREQTWTGVRVPLGVLFKFSLARHSHGVIWKAWLYPKIKFNIRTGCSDECD